VKQVGLNYVLLMLCLDFHRKYNREDGPTKHLDILPSQVSTRSESAIQY